jgi:nucleotide-binding universal stress UspA family protein
MIIPIRNILCPTDFSEPAREGFKNAHLLAKYFGAKLLVIHVNPPIPVMPLGHGAVIFDVAEYGKEMKTYAETRLKAFIAEKDGVGDETRSIIYEGDAAGEIVRAAEEHDTDLIVMATHGHSGWKRLVTGSVTEKVVRTASRPVLTIHMPSDAD